MGFPVDKRIVGVIWSLCLVFLVSGNEEDRSTCDVNEDKVKEIGIALENFTSCANATFSTTDAKKPMDCDKLQQFYGCFQNYLDSTKECLPAGLANWNKTLHAIDSVQQELCKDDNNLIEDFYRENGVECVSHEKVQECGLSLSTLLLNPDKGNVDKLLLQIENGNCRNISEINSCVVEKLKDKSICKSPNAANIFIQMNQIVANVTGCVADKDSANDFVISSTLIWIVAISVTGLVTLSPS